MLRNSDLENVIQDDSANTFIKRCLKNRVHSDELQLLKKVTPRDQFTRTDLHYIQLNKCR
ncbi:hypothetical protein NQ318_002417 [Aromia moschata]|uniref:Uncharacterized protein n=1 Tax=Aromia moschata TaxID=1265417 RepID=A0AAV8YE69_9CUCU|nr:hypothetical protein NQ318_002417 [Aromia moschata]